MDLGFGSAGLATLCNAERRMIERWGPDTGRTVGKRLLDLSAATAETVEQVPTATVVHDDDGRMTITFDDSIAMSGQLTTCGDGASTDTDQFVISRIRVMRDAR